ncbi:MAG: DEAD/DEAH box helicase [Verrucomicrobia bacterium]|nr:DEAD/DEAH box helicase [Verrucomicrobiota bacterium]
MQKKLFTELGLSPELLKAVARVGYEEASPIQSEAIPVLLKGADVFGQSQTGSGKTAAFALPAIELVDPAIRATQVLILCPTRELAVQVAEEVSKLAFFKRGVRELPIYGGQSYERQFQGLQRGAHIVIGTPGRVMDHMDRGTLKLDQIKMVILDEADRMLDMGFIDDIKNVLSKMPPERQTVMFSATLPGPIQQLVKSFTRNPVNIRIQDQALTVPNIEQVYYELDRRAKVEVLCRLIDIEDIKFGLIFCATKMMVDELTEHLTARGYAADKLHGDMSQAMRERVMAKFRKRGLEFLVATDVAARGVDVDDIEVVFNYDLPQDSEDYVHRIGRTGRAGRSGKAITFVAGREIWKLQNIMRATKGKIHRARVPSADEVEQKRTSAFYDLIRDTLEGGDYRRHDELIDQLLDQGHTPTDIASALIHLAGGEKARPATEREPVANMTIPRREERPERRQDSAPESRVDPFKKKKRPAEAVAAESGDLSERIGKARNKRDRNAEVEPSKVSHEPGMVRLSMNTGRDHEISPGDVVGVIAGLAKIPKESIGAIRLLARTTYVDVGREHAPRVLEKLNGIKFKGRNLFISLAE